ncbi:MAG: ABC transporter permease [Candidatus Kapaibacterium sp.]|jgi:ABC-2 type transport system permease protein
MKFRRVWPVIKKEFRQIARDKRSLGVLLVVPAFMLIMFGYALNYDVKNIPLALLDEDHSATSRDFGAQFLHSEYFTKQSTLSNRKQIDTLLDHAEARVILVIPTNFSEDLLAGHSTKVQVLVDGANATMAATYIGYLTAITQEYSTKVSLEALERAGIKRPTFPIDYRPRIWYNPELKSAKFLVPGLIGFILMVTTVIATSLSIVKEKERGTIEQLDVSPLMPLELITGKMLPYVLISLISTVIILITGSVLFDVVVQGSYFLLFILTLLFLAGGLGLGLFVSSVSKTQEAAFMLAVTLTFLPTFTLSGFTFPIRNMPLFIQGITYLFPARYFMVALRSLILKGAGFSVIWDDMLAMAIFALAIGAISWSKMRNKTLA